MSEQVAGEGEGHFLSKVQAGGGGRVGGGGPGGGSTGGRWMSPGLWEELISFFRG